MRKWLSVAASALGILAVIDCGGEGDGLPDRSGVGLPDRDSTTTSAEAGAGDPDARPAFPDEGDATTPVNGDVECDPNKPFGTPQLVFDAATRSATPRLSADELTIYFTADGAATDLFRAVRPSRTARFGAPELMAAHSSPSNDNDPSVSLDHLTLFFQSNRSGNTELYYATRASLSVDFGAPSLVPDVNDPTVADAHAYYRAGGGGELWFVSLRGSANYRIHVAKKSGQGFGTPSAIVELSGAWNDWQPMVTEDGLAMVFASTRPNGLGGYDLWISTRVSDSAAWSDPTPLAELNSAANEFAGWLSPDRCRIYFSSSRDTTDNLVQRAYFAARPL